jgi:hypothetical protein
MTVKIIAENILDDDDFSSATEQDGRYIGQPNPNSSNTGYFRPISKGDDDGDINTFTYSGTATGNGTTLTIVDSVLTKLGDDAINNMTITFTSGANNGQTKAISDFDGATGTITWSGALTSTATNDTFTVTLDPDDIDEIEMELTTAGDAGSATYKWKMTTTSAAGTGWLGREAPTNASWDGAETIDDSSSSSGSCKVVQAQNGNWLAIFSDSDDDLDYRLCTNGLAWGAATTIDDSDNYIVADAVVLSSGRILVYAITDGGDSNIFYSDDNGSTWSGPIVISENIWTARELPNGNVYAAYVDSGNIYGFVSIDGGMTYSSAVTISAASNAQARPSLCVDADGDLICAYQSDEDSSGDDEIKLKVSTDGGATWGFVIAVIDHNGTDRQAPSVCLDINGDIHLAYRHGTDKIYKSYSDDNGATWYAANEMVDGSGDTLQNPHLTLLDGHIMLGAYFDVSNTSCKAMRSGWWESYLTSAQDITVPKNALEAKFLCDIGVKWFGNAGVLSDNWTFEPKYEHGMINLITDNPERAWRSTQDNIACNININIGTYERILADGVAFFGSNLRTLDFQMDDTGSMPSPNPDENVSFDITSAGVVDSTDGNLIKDIALMANYNDHELAGKYLRMTSGTDNGDTHLIRDNVGDYIMLEVTAAHNIATDDTFAIFQDKVAATFNQSVKQYMRLAIGAQHTYDDYYQIGSMVVGKTVSLTKAWMFGYGKTIKSGIDYVRPANGGMIPIERRSNKRIFSVQWNAATTTKDELVALYEYLKGKNLALIPDDDDLTDVYLVKIIGNIELRHWYSDKFNFKMTFEEV